MQARALSQADATPDITGQDPLAHASSFCDGRASVRVQLAFQLVAHDAYLDANLMARRWASALHLWPRLVKARMGGHSGWITTAPGLCEVPGIAKPQLAAWRLPG